MLEALILGLTEVFQWPAIGFLMLGVLIGIWLGAVPGLGGIIGLVLLLPFTFDMKAVDAFALLLGMYAVTTTSDTIASVMLGIPGSAASQATILDGYPMAQKGHAARALGAAFTVSAFGGVFGALVLAASLPIVLPIILAFGSPELFMLGVLGLTMVGSLSGGSIAKGVTVAALGLLLSTIGYAETIAIPRYWFGAEYLLDELPLIPVVLGLFAIPEALDLATRNQSISRVPSSEVEGGGILDGVRDALRHWWLATRCAAIGSYIGILPGLGGAIVDWIAYGHAVQSAKDKSGFGQGDVRGVIAPEAANNASRGGSLIPTVAFGIPGTLGAAILLGALLIQGLRPGPDMLTTDLHITFSMVWSIVIANIVVVVILMLWCQHLTKVAFLPGHLIVPAVMLFVFMGAWLAGASIGDWVTVLAAGVAGYWMKRGGWPRPPLILALILGTIMENAFQISMRVHLGWGWMGRPVVLIILAIAVLTVVLAARGVIKGGDSAAAVPRLGEGREVNPVMSLPLSLLLLATFVAAGIVSLDWPASVRQFPLTIAVPGALLALLSLWVDGRGLVTALRERRGAAAALRDAAARSELLRSALFLGYLLALVAVMPAVGQKIALTGFIAVYLLRWGGYSWRLALAYAGCSWLFLVVFYDRIMHLYWHPSWLSAWLPGMLPAWLPRWLFF